MNYPQALGVVSIAVAATCALREVGILAADWIGERLFTKGGDHKTNK